MRSSKMNTNCPEDNSRRQTQSAQESLFHCLAKQERENTLTEFLIGAGGWAYFHVPGEDSLSAYAKAFNFVEVNSTFYEYPDTGTVRSWRKRIPQSFEFSVRCHRDVTESNMMKPSDANIASLDRMLDVCEILQAPILHIQIPRGVEFNSNAAAGTRDLLNSVSLGQVRVALEIARGKGGAIDPHVTAIMQDLDIIHCVDLSREDPAYRSDVLYARLFGPTGDNIYQFSDQELKGIGAKASTGEFEKSILAFHGVKMYKDAARLKIFKSTQSFPMVTSSQGLESLREVLSEDSSFPTSKASLVERQGWKIIDLTAENRIRAANLLGKLPTREYSSIDDVIATLRKMQQNRARACSSRSSSAEIPACKALSVHIQDLGLTQ